MQFIVSRFVKYYFQTMLRKSKIKKKTLLEVAYRICLFTKVLFGILCTAFLAHTKFFRSKGHFLCTLCFSLVKSLYARLPLPISFIIMDLSCKLTPSTNQISEENESLQLFKKVFHSS